MSKPLATKKKKEYTPKWKCPISHFLSPVSCDSLMLQGLRCEWGAGLLNLGCIQIAPYNPHSPFPKLVHSYQFTEGVNEKEEVNSDTAPEGLTLLHSLLAVY